MYDNRLIIQMPLLTHLHAMFGVLAVITCNMISDNKFRKLWAKIDRKSQCWCEAWVTYRISTEHTSASSDSMSVCVRGELLNKLSKLNNKIHVFSHVSHSKSRTPENTKKQNTPYALHHTKCCVLDVRSRRLSSGRLVICNFKHG